MFKYKTDRTPLTQYSICNWRQRQRSRRCLTRIVLIASIKSLSQIVKIIAVRTRYTLIRLNFKLMTTQTTRIIYRAIRSDSSGTKTRVKVNKMVCFKAVNTRNCSNMRSIHQLAWTQIMVISTMISMHFNQRFNNKPKSCLLSSFLKKTRDIGL